jgi:hypothetical protein
LGGLTNIDDIEIHWPSGTKQEIHPPNVDVIITVVEGKGVSGNP